MNLCNLLVTNVVTGQLFSPKENDISLLIIMTKKDEYNIRKLVETALNYKAIILMTDTESIVEPAAWMKTVYVIRLPALPIKTNGFGVIKGNVLTTTTIPLSLFAPVFRRQLEPYWGIAPDINSNTPHILAWDLPAYAPWTGEGHERSPLTGIAGELSGMYNATRSTSKHRSPAVQEIKNSILFFCPETEKYLVGYQARLQNRGRCKVRFAWLGCSLDRAVWLLRNHWTACKNEDHQCQPLEQMPVTDIADRAILEARHDSGQQQKLALLVIKFAVMEHGNMLTSPSWQVPRNQYAISTPVAMVILKDFVV